VPIVVNRSMDGDHPPNTLIRTSPWRERIRGRIQIYSRMCL